MSNTWIMLGQRWAFDPFIAVNLLLVSVAYGWAWRAARAKAGWSTWAGISFYAAITVLWVSYLGPFAAWSHTFFVAHMCQHLLVMMVAAPLLVLSNPVTLAFVSLGGSGRRRMAAILRGRAVQVLTNPWLTWIAFAVVLTGTHFTNFYNLALTNHDLDTYVQQPLYLIAAVLFYFPLIGSNLQPRRPTHAVRLMSLGLMMVPEAVTGAVLYFAPHVLYPYYNTIRSFGPDPITDQRLAGAIMWAMAMIIDSGWMMLAAVEWFADEERKSRRQDAQLRQELLAQSQ